MQLEGILGQFIHMTNLVGFVLYPILYNHSNPCIFGPFREEQVGWTDSGLINQKQMRKVVQTTLSFFDTSSIMYQVGAHKRAASCHGINEDFSFSMAYYHLHQYRLQTPMHILLRFLIL